MHSIGLIGHDGPDSIYRFVREIQEPIKTDKIIVQSNILLGWDTLVRSHVVRRLLFTSDKLNPDELF